jgi:hypothetical protein
VGRCDHFHAQGVVGGRWQRMEAYWLSGLHRLHNAMGRRGHCCLHALHMGFNAAHVEMGCIYCAVKPS